MGLLNRIRSLLDWKPETKSWTYTSDGWLNKSWGDGWFQQGYSAANLGNGPVVEACISAYAQTVSQLTLRLWKDNENGDGGRTQITSDGDSRYSNIARLLHRPNGHQTRSDFILNLIYSMLLDGNGYFYGSGAYQRPTDLWLLNSSQTQGHRAPTGDVYYSTGGPYSDWAEIPSEAIIPERFVGHVRLHTPQDPLVGVTPIAAAVQSIAANSAMTAHQANFFRNMSRPSGVLSTDMELTADQMKMLREAWNDQSKNLNSGGLPILGFGLKYDQMSITSQDAQLVEAWKMSVEDISRVFRVPLPLINSMENATLNNAETLMNFWLSSGLGFVLRHIEENMERFFDLDERYNIEFDIDRLLRADLKGRMDALGTAVTKGIYSPNEARRKEGLPDVEGGEMPRVQQQMVALDWEEPQAAPAVADTPPETVEPIDEKFLLAASRSHLEGMRHAA